MRPDILVRDAGGNAVLAVEVKARRGVDHEWAAQLRRNLSAHGTSVDAGFFMIVTTDEAFLWRDTDEDRLTVRPPDATIETRDLLGNELVSAPTLDGRTLELVVAAWLKSIVAEEDITSVRPSVHRFLIASGLLDALRGSTNLVAFEFA